MARSQATTVISGVVNAAMDAYIETGEGIVGRGKRNIMKRDFRDIYLLLDVVEGLGGAISEYEGVVKASSITRVCFRESHNDRFLL